MTKSQARILAKENIKKGNKFEVSA